MTFVNYLKISKVLILLNLPLSVLGTFFVLRDFSTYLILLPFSFLDFIFIYSNYNRITFKKIEILLITILISTLFIGLINSASFSRRHITDFINPLFFILKISIFRNSINLNITFFKDYILLLVKQLFFVGLGSLVFFFILSIYKPMYIGLTPTTHPYLIISMLNGKTFNQILSILVILLSGKRALLISSFIIFMVYQFFIKNKKKLLLYIVGGIIALITTFSIFKSGTESISAFDKYVWTYEVFLENKDDLTFDSEVLNTLTAGRIAEIQGATELMRPYEYLIGKGVGFTYTYYSQSLSEDVSDYANLHFTPLSIITKYGVFFYLIFMVYIISSLKNYSKKGYFSILFGLYIIASLIDMLFAYTVFVDPLIPISLGFLTSLKYLNHD